MSPQKTTFNRATSAILIGAFTGGLSSGIWVSIFIIATGGMGETTAWQHVVSFAILLGMAGAMWLAGLVILGVPAMILMHFLRFRKMRDSLITGCILSLVGPCYLSYSTFGNPKEIWTLVFSGGFLPIGIGVALVIWRITYADGKIT